MGIDLPSAAFRKLTRAVADGDVAAVRGALKKVTPDDHPGNLDGDSLLMVAIRSGRDIEILRILIEEGKADVDFRAPNGKTALQVATAAKRADVVALLRGKPPAPAKPSKTADQPGSSKAKPRAAPGGYVIWEDENEPDAWSLGGLEGVSMDWKLLSGEAFGSTWPARARFPLENQGNLGGPRGPKKARSPVLTDQMHNTDSVLVLSERLAEVVRRTAGDTVELLAVKLAGPDGKAIPQRYVIAHPVGTVDAIDAAASKLTRSKSGEVLSVKRLALDEARIPKGRALFRLAGYRSCFVASRALADAIRALEPTGTRFVEIAAHHEP